MDRARIVASYYYYSRDELNCQKIIEKELRKPGSRGREEEIRKRYKVSLNCSGVRDDRKLVANGYDFRKCLCNFIHPKFGHYYNLNKAYNLGRSLYADKYTDEPNQTIEIIDLLDELKIDLENENNKKLEKKQQDAAKKGKRK